MDNSDAEVDENVYQNTKLCSRTFVDNTMSYDKLTVRIYCNYIEG